MWLSAFDDDALRVRPEVRYAILREERCARRGHLQAVVFKSAYGRWVAWRPGEIRGARSSWAQEWLDDAGDSIEVTCHCDKTRRVDLSAARLMQ